MRCDICDEPLKHIHNEPKTGRVAPCETCQAVINELLPEDVWPPGLYKDGQNVMFDIALLEQLEDDLTFISECDIIESVEREEDE